MDEAKGRQVKEGKKEGRETKRNDMRGNSLQFVVERGGRV